MKKIMASFFNPTGKTIGDLERACREGYGCDG